MVLEYSNFKFFLVGKTVITEEKGLLPNICNPIDNCCVYCLKHPNVFLKQNSGIRRKVVQCSEHFFFYQTDNIWGYTRRLLNLTCPSFLMLPVPIIFFVLWKGISQWKCIFVCLYFFTQESSSMVPIVLYGITMVGIERVR